MTLVHWVKTTTVSHRSYGFQNQLEGFNSPVSFLTLTIYFDLKPDSFGGMSVWTQECILGVGLSHVFVWLLGWRLIWRYYPRLGTGKCRRCEVGECRRLTTLLLCVSTTVKSTMTWSQGKRDTAKGKRQGFRIDWDTIGTFERLRQD